MPLQARVSVDRPAFLTLPGILAIGAVLLTLLNVQAHLWLWHPGVRAYDELGELARIQDILEGHTRAWSYFGGHAWTAMAYAALDRCLGAWAVHARLLGSAALALEAWLLYRLATRYWSSIAGLASVLVLCGSAYTLARTRTLFSFQSLPAVLLLLLSLQTLARRPLVAAAWGFALGLALLDYEAWAVAVPALGVAWFYAHQHSERPPGLPMLAGFVMGAGLVAFLTVPQLNSYVSQRAQEFRADHWATLGHHLRQLFFGNQGNEAFVRGLSAWPRWSMLFLVLGIGRVMATRPWLLAFIFFGLLPMAVGSGSTEANRALVAWPALLLCCGAGADFIWIRTASKWRAGASVLLALAVLAGVVHEWRAYESESVASDHDAYDYSRRLTAARDFLAARSGDKSLRVITDLNYRGMGEARYSFNGLSSAEAAETWVLLFDVQLPPGPRPAWGEWQEFRSRPDGRALLLLRPTPGTEKRFVRAEAELRTVLGLESRLPERIRRTGPFLLSDASKDPLVESIALDAYLRAQENIAWAEPGWEAVLEGVEPQTSRQGLAYAQAWESLKPAKSLAYLLDTLRDDPDRPNGQRILSDFLLRHPELKP